MIYLTAVFVVVTLMGLVMIVESLIHGQRYIPPVGVAVAIFGGRRSLRLARTLQRQEKPPSSDLG
jgi:hypothetical protein